MRRKRLFKKSVVQKALITTINRYKRKRGFSSIDLAGCNNDGAAMMQVLRESGMRKKDILVKEDSQVTANKLRRTLKCFLSNIGKGKLAVWYRSCHGSQIADLNGDEYDGLDEIICTHDIQYGGFVCDDEINEMISKYLHPKAKLLIIVDSCHSGTSNRMIGQQHTKKFVDVADFGITQKNFILESEGQPGHKNVVTWSACMDSQVSWETSLGGQKRGLFTYHLEQKLSKVLAKSMTIKEAHIKMERALFSANMPEPQTPNLALIKSQVSINDHSFFN